MLTPRSSRSGSVLWLRRHAPTAWNRDKRLQGREDIPLLPESLTALAKQRLPPSQQSLPCFSSPLQRCQQTALALGLSPQLEPAWIEMDWGDWSGWQLAELRQHAAEALYRQERRGLHLQPPHGESPFQVGQRVQAWLRCTELPSQAVVVTHKGVIRALLAIASAWTMQAPYPERLLWQQWFCFTWQQEQLLFLGQAPDIEMDCA